MRLAWYTKHTQSYNVYTKVTNMDIAKVTDFIARLKEVSDMFRSDVFKFRYCGLTSRTRIVLPGLKGPPKTVTTRHLLAIEPHYNI